MKILDSKLAKEWHPTLNGELKLQDVTAGSQKKVWWLCSKGHKWEAIIASRNNGSGCPYCAGRAPLIKGETDLATVNKVLAQEWHPTLNGELKSQDVTAGSSKKAWWLCSKGHKWEARIASRNNGSGCPYCAGRAPLTNGETDLATVNKVLAQEWHPTLNGELKPQGVTVGSPKKAWWLCSKGHEWEAVIANRNNGSGCPYCNGRKIPLIVGKTDLATVHKVLAQEWHPTLNGELKPQDVTAGSGKKAWWLCSKGHKWEAVINDRSNGSGCPFCAGRAPLTKGETDLATVNKVLAQEWHPTLNGELKPQDVTVGSSKKVWWLCSKGHEWEAVINTRNNGTGCPYCNGKRPLIVGETDLATVNQVLAKEWHPTLNRELKPQDVTPGSSKKVWWLCSKGHEWEAIIHNRNSGKGCPYCAGKKK